MVLKAIKTSLKINCQKNILVKKKILRKKKKTNSDKQIFSEIFRRSCEKQCFLHLEHI